MQRTEPPDEIRRLADARQDARDARDFALADRLKADIEAAGWNLLDQAQSYRLQRAHPPDIEEPDGRIRYGWSGSVPSRLAAPPRGVASVVLIAPDDPDMLERALAGLASAVTDDVQRIVVANGVDAEIETMLITFARQWGAEAAAGSQGAAAAGGAEAVWLIGRMGVAAALNAGIRRAAAPVVVILDGASEAIGDVISPLVAALADPTVAVAGPWGLTSQDLRNFAPVAPGNALGPDVTAITLGAIAFRRADYVERGPLDERFIEPALLDAWWSLVLRDPETETDAARRAVLVDIPLVRPDPAFERLTGRARDSGPRSDGEDSSGDHVVRRNRYRIIDRFGNRRDLADRATT